MKAQNLFLESDPNCNNFLSTKFFLRSVTLLELMQNYMKLKILNMKNLMLKEISLWEVSKIE